MVWLWLAAISGVLLPYRVEACTGGDMLPPEDQFLQRAARRAVEPVDLVKLRDIGSTIDTTGDDVVALSPDKSLVAFQVRRADPVTNRYCLAMVIMGTNEGARPHVLDSGGEFIRLRYEQVTGKADVPTGLPKVVSPRWFNDSKSFAFLKRVDGSTQVWRAFVDGSPSVRLSHSKSDVTDFRLATDQHTLILSTRAWIDDAYREIEAEGSQGHLVDDRYFPIASNVPFIPAPAKKTFITEYLDTGEQREASEAEQALFLPFAGLAPPNSISAPLSGDLRRAWAFYDPAGSAPYSIHLAAEERIGSRKLCEHINCVGNISSVWWSGDGRKVRYLRREGWARSLTAIYEWNPEEGAPRKLYETSGVLFDCKPFNNDLICLTESSLNPRRIIRLDLRRKRQHLIFDPNPEFASLLKGRVRRLQWSTAFGSEAFGDLVLPVHYNRNRRYPLIVVQYATRGFLRGGTGDEYPIQVFANNGFAVLSVERPLSPADHTHAKNYLDLDKADLAGFIDKRNVLSAIERGVLGAVDRGIADPRRIGISGLSDGASTVQFAAVHSDLFAAASISNCCAEPTQLSLLGPAAAKLYRDTGWPALTSEDTQFWSQISWVANARKIELPVLMQMADREYRSGLAAFTALREADVPVEMRVFPDETHFKWQPVHRLSIYTRNLNWFSFWLQNSQARPRLQVSDVARWDQLKCRQSVALARIASCPKQ